MKMKLEILDEKMIEILKQKSPQERLSIAFNLWKTARKFLVNHLKNTHPDWDEEKIRMEVLKRFLYGSIRTPQIFSKYI